jgi:hypothetical protein
MEPKFYAFEIPHYFRFDRRPYLVVNKMTTRKTVAIPTDENGEIPVLVKRLKD